MFCWWGALVTTPAILYTKPFPGLGGFGRISPHNAGISLQVLWVTLGRLSIEDGSPQLLSCGSSRGWEPRGARPRAARCNHTVVRAHGLLETSQLWLRSGLWGNGLLQALPGGETAISYTVQAPNLSVFFPIIEGYYGNSEEQLELPQTMSQE